eukprot:6883549-Alexandrium_andersonii.AAC.1
MAPAYATWPTFNCVPRPRMLWATLTTAPMPWTLCLRQRALRPAEDAKVMDLNGATLAAMSLSPLVAVTMASSC